jgi:hypothetical protein
METARKVRHEDGDEAGRRWKVPKESPSGPDLTLKELEVIAWGEARRSPGLTPNGGRRWTAEDIAFAVAILDDETRSRAFRKASNAGMNKPQARRWLAKAIHNRLLDHAKCGRRLLLLDDLVLDDFAAVDSSRRPLDPGDAAILADRVLGKLRVEEGAILADRLLGGRGGTNGQVRETRADRASRRTRAYRWARVREILRAVAMQTGLDREEVLDLLAALAVKVTVEGGGNLWENSLNPLHILAAHPLTLIGARS